MRARLIPLAAATAAAAFGLAACGSSDDSGYIAMPEAPAAAPSTSAPAPSSSATTQPASPATPGPSSTATPAPPPKAGLQLGDKGPEVLALQKRLQELHFWISAADGTFGDTTQQAIFAVQKAAGLSRDGVAGPQTMKALQQGVSVQPRSTSGHWIEIDKTKQLLMIVNDGRVDTILNTSTGSNQPYQQGGQTYIATTPSGQYHVYMQIDGLDRGPLGDLWRPKYFNGGIAVHGAGSVPPYPASHGCARLSNPAIDWIWASNQAPIGTAVWVF